MMVDVVGEFEQTFTSNVNKEMMMAKEISSKDWDKDWGQLKCPMITFGPKLERNNSGPTAGHSRSVGGNKADTGVGK